MFSPTVAVARSATTLRATIPHHFSQRLATPARTLIASALLAAVTAPAAAQTQFGELPRKGLGGGPHWVLAVVLGDVDGDGDLDLVTGKAGWNQLYRNDGTGSFSDATASHMPMEFDASSSTVLADVDGDGDLDLVIGNEGQNRICKNDGTGTFSDATANDMPVDNDDTRSVALGDVDGDGDLDLVIGNSGYPNGQQNRLYMNNGTGTFSDATASHMPVDNDDSRSTALGDVDGDGSLDLVIGNAGQNRLYLNDGTGTFADATTNHVPIDSARTYSVTLGDVDGDGDLDMAMGNPAQPSRLYFNLQRQLHAPTAPQIGQPYSLDCYMRNDTSTIANFALPYLSTAPASIAVPPFGTLGIDLTMAAPFAPLMVPQPIGVGSIGFTVPNVSSLIGQRIYSQAMLVAYPFDLRLSNVCADVIQ